VKIRSRALRLVALLALLLIGATLLVRSANSFLSIDKPVHATVLIVEGWLPDYAMQGAIEEFKRGSYNYVLTSGRTLPGAWLASRFKTSAEFAAANLAALGLQTNVIVAVPPPEGDRDRTYASAVAVRQWLDTNSSVHAVNIYSLGAHARRSQLLFRKALGDKVSVGVLAHPDNSYDPSHWWASMDGFQEVTCETMAYVYAKFLFHPSQ